TQSDAEKAFPAVAAPAEGAQALPVQEPGTRPHRPALVTPHADVTVDRSAFTVTATLSSTGRAGVSLQVFPDRYLPAAATPFTVVSGRDRTYQWNAALTAGHGYAFSVYGPDGFVRSFAGEIVPAGATTGPVPRVAATLAAGRARILRLTLANDGAGAVTYTLTPNDYAGTTRTVTVGGPGTAAVTWPVNADGYYDVTVTAGRSDGFTRRYAGRIA
ncbi:MAG TPA: phospholipase domain-containing protein, partial [Trebonia sp.]